MNGRDRLMLLLKKSHEQGQYITPGNLTLPGDTLKYIAKLESELEAAQQRAEKVEPRIDLLECERDNARSVIVSYGHLPDCPVVMGASVSCYCENQMESKLIELQAECDSETKWAKEYCDKAVTLRKALEELVDLMQDTIDGNYKPDSFTLQTARQALAKFEV